MTPRPDVLVCALDQRDPYMDDRDYPQPAEWADGANPFARPHPDLPWVHRGLPLRSCGCGGLEGRPVVELGHQRTRHDFPTPDRRTGPLLAAVDRPERIA